MTTISKIHYITQDHPDLSHAEQARLVFEAGYSCVQIRMKNHSSEEIKKEIRQAKEHADKWKGTLILNDFPELAKESGLTAVHLGINDMPIREARKLLGEKCIIGGTANNFNTVVNHYENGADYIGLGPYQFTTTKKNLSPIIGLEGYRKICKQLKNAQIHIPILAVGGIHLNEFKLLQQAGLWGIALSGGLLRKIEKKYYEAK